MGNLWLKIKVWTKIIIIVLLASYVALFTWNNSERTVEFWVAPTYLVTRTVFWLVISAFAVGFIAALLLRTTLSTIRQFKEMKQAKLQQKLQRDIADMHTKAAMLQTKPAAEPRQQQVDEDNPV